MTETIMTIGIFFLLQIINVMLNTAKTLIMARADNSHLSALANAVTFGFYVTVVKQIASLPLSITIVVTIITNIIGVYVTYAIMNRTKKDNLWKIEIFSKQDIDHVNVLLDKAEIAFTPINNKVTVAYAYSQEESRAVRVIINTIGAKCNVTEITKRL